VHVERACRSYQVLGCLLLEYILVNMPQLTTYNVLIGVIVAIGTFGYGYGFGVFITSIGQPGFYVDLNLDRKFRVLSSNVFLQMLTWRLATSKYTAK